MDQKCRNLCVLNVKAVSVHVVWNTLHEILMIYYYFDMILLYACYAILNIDVTQVTGLKRASAIEKLYEAQVIDIR